MTTTSLLPTGWSVPQEFRDRLGSSVGRQRAMKSDDHLLLVLHEPPKPDDRQRNGRFFWRQPDDTWRSKDLGSGTAILAKHLNDFDNLNDAFDRRIEEATTAEDYFSVLEELAPIHRAARNLHAVLQDARKMFPEDRILIDARDRAYDIERSAELLYSEGKNAMDYAVARRAEEQARIGHRMARSAHRLNVLVALFFPMATLSAVFGVNMIHGYEEASAPWAFIIMVAVGLATGCLLTAFVTRK